MLYFALGHMHQSRHKCNKQSSRCSVKSYTQIKLNACINWEKKLKYPNGLTHKYNKQNPINDEEYNKQWCKPLARSN